MGIGDEFCMGRALWIRLHQAVHNTLKARSHSDPHSDTLADSRRQPSYPEPTSPPKPENETAANDELAPRKYWPQHIRSFVYPLAFSVYPIGITFFHPCYYFPTNDTAHHRPTNRKSKMLVILHYESGPIISTMYPAYPVSVLLYIVFLCIHASNGPKGGDSAASRRICLHRFGSHA
jgi:hypothetical protein